LSPQQLEAAVDRMKTMMRVNSLRKKIGSNWARIMLRRVGVLSYLA
jgi:hypothetical protein